MVLFAPPLYTRTRGAGLVTAPFEFSRDVVVVVAVVPGAVDEPLHRQLELLASNRRRFVGERRRFGPG